jgi:hypothetical protein
LSDIKLLKMSRPKNDTPQNEGSNEPGLGADQLGELFDTIN